MPGNFFPRLEDQGLIRDQDKQWNQKQTISAQKIITGSIQAEQEIQSANFVAGSAGWQIDGDGNAEFNDVTIRGVLIAEGGSDVDWSHISNVSIDNADINSLSFSKITAASNTATLTMGSAGEIKSSNYSAVGKGNGDAEFNDVTVHYRGFCGVGG